MLLRPIRVPVWILLFASGLVLVGGCDVPSSGPSLETETGVNTPVVVNKTFSFLGGTESRHEPLIDTTTSQFDSLFAVAETDQSISIEEEVSAFDFGSLDQALDEATEGIGASASISERVMQGSDLASQEITAQYTKENGQPDPVPSPGDPPPSDSGPLPTETIVPFPIELPSFPEQGVANVDADGVERGTLTDEDKVNGRRVNKVDFTLVNNDPTSAPLTDGSGGAPSITIRNKGVGEVGTAQFRAPVDPGTEKTATADIKKGTLIDQKLQLVFKVSGRDGTDEFSLEMSPLQYRKATLTGVNSVEVTAKSTLSTVGEDSPSQFEGIEPRKGTLEVTLVNNFRFPIDVTTLSLENNEGTALPDTFETLGISESAQSISPGASEPFTVDLEGRGIASTVDVEVRGTLAGSYEDDTLTVAAGDSIRTAVSTGDEFSIGALFFWPDGETVQVDGRFGVEANRISFDRPEDFVELEDGRLTIENLVSEPTVSFDSFDLQLLDITRQGEPLTVSLAGIPETKEKNLRDARLSPTNDQVTYSLQGTLEDVARTEQTADNLQVLRYDDEIRGDVSVGALQVRAVEAGVDPFSVDVTTDANGDGRLDLSDDREASEASFGEFDGLSDQTENLRLTGTELKFRADTDIGTHMQLYAALQGRNGTTRTYLSGTNSEKRVPSAANGGEFYNGAREIASEDLIQFGVKGASKNTLETRSISLTNENSTVDDFLSTFPTSLRFVAQARLGGEEGRLQLRRPVTFDTGLSVAVPVRLKGSFAISDTIDADFSGLDDITDPTKEVTVSAAELRVRFTNALPVGADAELFVLDENQNQVLSLPDGDESLRVKAPAKADDGTADGSRTGATSLDLSTAQLRDLAAGRRLALRLTMDQAEEGGAATFRATDTIELSLEASVEASVSVNN